jgi:hypothetical protein
MPLRSLANITGDRHYVRLGVNKSDLEKAMTTTNKSQSNKNTAPKCAHPGCNCPARPGEKYCSDLCENLVGSDMCACGHAECKGKTGAHHHER